MSHSWNVERVFNNYSDALQYKSTVQQSDRGAILQVKIKRYAPVNGVQRYGVKVRNDPSLVEAIKEVEQKTSKRQKKTKE